MRALELSHSWGTETLHGIRPVIDRVLPWTEATRAVKEMASGSLRKDRPHLSARSRFVACPIICGSGLRDLLVRQLNVLKRMDEHVRHSRTSDAYL